MTNRISSAQQAEDALMKLKSKAGSRVLLEVSAPLLSFSVEGNIADFDGNTLVIAGEGMGFVPPEMTLSGLRAFIFDGDFRDDVSEMFLTLMMTRNFDDFHIHIRGVWQEAPTVRSTRIN